jgi:hypothetical protein
MTLGVVDGVSTAHVVLTLPALMSAATTLPVSLAPAMAVPATLQAAEAAATTGRQQQHCHIIIIIIPSSHSINAIALSHATYQACAQPLAMPLPMHGRHTTVACKQEYAAVYRSHSACHAVAY